MVVNKQGVRLIFGLKLKQLRLQKGLSFAELSKAAGVSVSYLNEIEKGKKYPKSDKIIALAQALGVSYDQLVSLKLSKKLAPVAELLNSGIFDSLPLELFGLEPSTLLEIISNAPTQFNAFISTLLKIARSYEMSQENFYFAALRSYQEMHDNYFEELEVAVDQFLEAQQLDNRPPLSREALARVLTGAYGYRTDREALGRIPELGRFRSVFSPGKRILYINPALSAMQQSFLLGKEIAFNYLQLAERPYVSSPPRVASFEEVLNNFKASYFSVALLMNRSQMIEDLEGFFGQEQWRPDLLLGIIRKYEASPEMFFHRVSNLLPRHFGLDNFFFLRFHDYLDEAPQRYHLTKELHLSRLHSPHRNDLNEHYCRRWVAIRILEQMRAAEGEEYRLECQRSHFTGTKAEYLALSIARAETPGRRANVSVTLGIQVDAAARKRIRFLDSSQIALREVGETCERCPLSDCRERVAPPVEALRKASQAETERKLKQLLEAD